MSRLRITRRTFVTASAATLVGGATGPLTGALGQQPQGKPVQLILPVAAASGVDTLVRAAQNELSKAFAAPIVINNQPGAGGVIGTQQLVKSQPDGQTLSVISINHVIYPSVLKSVPFDPIADITPITTLVATPLILVVNPNKISARTAQELTALLNANPDKFHYGSSGNGTVLHLAGAMYVEQAGVKVTHVPYKGVGPLLTDLIGGQIDMAVIAYPSIISHLKSGALRAIGVASSQRMAVSPDIATFAEQGMPNMVVEGWSAAVGPPKLPAADVTRIHAAFTTAFKSAEVTDAIAKQASVLKIATPQQTLEFLKEELAKYASITKKIGLEPQ